MPIEQNMWGALRPVVVGDNHWVARRVAQRGVEPNIVEGINQVLARLTALIFIGGVGGDRFNPQQFKQSVQRSHQIGVNCVQGFVQIAHCLFSMH